MVPILLLRSLNIPRKDWHDVYLCKSINSCVFANQHVSQLLKHIVLQRKEGLVGNTKARHQHNHLPVQVQTTYSQQEQVSSVVAHRGKQ